MAEWTTRKDGFFVYLALPVGTVIKGDEAVLPDGRKVQLNQTIAGQTIKPWEIKWDDEPEVPTTRHLHWANLFFLGLLLPLALWGLAEIIVAVASWVTRGFSHQDDA